MNMNRSVRRLGVGVLGVLMLTVSVLSLSTAASAQIGIGISVRIAPPALPVYAQPICPGPAYFWTPGYWAWNEDGGYYWVPGTWVVAPVACRDPRYGGFAGGFYGWHWGSSGTARRFLTAALTTASDNRGEGFFGGEWRGERGCAVTNVNVTNVRMCPTAYVVVNNTNVAFTGPGGVVVLKKKKKKRNANEPKAVQREHEHSASQNRALFASENHGRPDT